MNEPSFTSGRIASALGLKMPTLHGWLNKGLVPLPADKPAHGWQRFTLRDLLLTALLAELSKSGLHVGLAAGIVRGAVPAVEKLQNLPLAASDHVWLAARRFGDCFQCERIFSLEEIAADDGGAPIVVLVDLAATVRRTLARIAEQDAAELRAAAGPQLCPKCLAQQTPDDQFFFCPHNQTVAMADYSESGALVGWQTMGPVTEDQVRTAIARLSQDKATVQ